MATRIRHPQNVIKEAVEKYLAGEPVRVLAKLYGVSRPCFYQWISKYKAARISMEERARMTPQAQNHADKRDLQIKNRLLEQDIVRLKADLFDCVSARFSHTGLETLALLAEYLTGGNKVKDAKTTIHRYNSRLT